MLLRHEDIKLRWHRYFSQLLNEIRGPKEEDRNTSDIQRPNDFRSTSDITTEEVGVALKKIGRSKAIEPDKIRIEMWRGLGI